MIVLRGAGRAFCAGYDFGGGFHYWDEMLTTDGEWDPGKDFVGVTAHAVAPTQKFMSIWRSPKPVIAQVHGWCVGGGSDLALCADLVIASEAAGEDVRSAVAERDQPFGDYSAAPAADKPDPRHVIEP